MLFVYPVSPFKRKRLLEKEKIKRTVDDKRKIDKPVDSKFGSMVVTGD